MPTTMGKPEVKNFSAPAQTRPFEKGQVEILHLGQSTIARATFEPGWKWSTCIKPIANTKSCEAAHLGYQLSGEMVVKMDEGTEITSRAGDVVYIPPGHDGWVIGNEPAVFLDFQGMVHYAEHR